MSEPGLDKQRRRNIFGMLSVVAPFIGLGIWFAINHLIYGGTLNVFYIWRVLIWSVLMGLFCCVLAFHRREKNLEWTYVGLVINGIPVLVVLGRVW